MQFQFYRNWVEFFFFVVMGIGLIIAVITPSALVSYIIVFLCGCITGRILYSRRSRLQAPYYIITVGFITGYALGAYYGNKLVIIILYVIANILTYSLYEKQVVRDSIF